MNGYQAVPALKCVCLHLTAMHMDAFLSTTETGPPLPWGLEPSVMINICAPIFMLEI